VAVFWREIDIGTCVGISTQFKLEGEESVLFYPVPNSFVCSPDLKFVNHFRSVSLASFFLLLPACCLLHHSAPRTKKSRHHRHQQSCRAAAAATQYYFVALLVGASIHLSRPKLETKAMGETTKSNATVGQGEIPCSNDAQFWLDLGRAVGDDDTINPCVDIPSVVIVDSLTTTTTVAPSTEQKTSSTATAAYKTFYSCSSVDANGNSGGAASPSIPEDAIEVKLTYSYELHTSSPLDDDILSSLSNDITYDIADRYGLVDCSFDSSVTKRRSLRSLKKGDVLALDSMPLDKSVADKYACEVQVTPSSTTDTICTPVRGSMTVWLPTSTSNKTQIKSELLTIIENGMVSDSYTNEDVVKVVYVGKRTSDTTKDLEMDPAKEQETLGSQYSESSNGSPLIATGISLFFVAIAVAIILVMYNRRKRRRKYFSDGPDDTTMGYPNHSSSLAAQAALADRQQQFASKDPDDIQLLPSMDRIDMRSVYSSEGSTSMDAETENYTDGTVGKYNYMYDGNEASDLAAMGMSSTLATQTFHPDVPSVE
jgi:hypothetical protein